MRSLILTTILTITTGPVFAHSGAAPAPPAPRQAKPVEFKLKKLTDRAYCLYGRGGNVGFLVTDAGVVEKAARPAGRNRRRSVRSRWINIRRSNRRSGRLGTRSRWFTMSLGPRA